jgi:hypothetical protein
MRYKKAKVCIEGGDGESLLETIEANLASRSTNYSNINGIGVTRQKKRTIYIFSAKSQQIISSTSCCATLFDMDKRQVA